MQVVARHRQPGRYKKRQEHEQTHDQDHDKRNRAFLEQREYRMVPWRNIPNFIHRVLQLTKHPGSANQQHAKTKHRLPSVGAHIGRLAQNHAHRVRTLIADQRPDLIDHRSAGSIARHGQADQRQGDDDERRKREHHVEGQRRAHSRNAVGIPLADGLSD